MISYLKKVKYWLLEKSKIWKNLFTFSDITYRKYLEEKLRADFALKYSSLAKLALKLYIISRY
jgi:hypothetical protein